MTATSTRRAVLAGAAAIPALSLPAIAAEPDPIFAAVERHKAAYYRRMAKGRIWSEMESQHSSRFLTAKSGQRAVR